jgi:hypothetical protein
MTWNFLKLNKVRIEDVQIERKKLIVFLQNLFGISVSLETRFLNLLVLSDFF